MCRTVHAILSIGICGVQMLVRVFMTVILMIENLIRMLLQTFYNFLSFLLQLISLIPICVVFLVTARLKCFMCGGGGPCPVNRGGACDCLMSAVALIILFFIFRATGVLDKIFYKIGYVQAPPIALVRFVPATGPVTNCSRYEHTSTTTAETTTPLTTSTTETTTQSSTESNITETITENDNNTESTTKSLLRGDYYMDYTTATETELDEEEIVSKPVLTTALKKIALRNRNKPEKSNLKSRSNPGPKMGHGRRVVSVADAYMNSDVESSEKLKGWYPSNFTTVLFYLV